MRSCCVRSRSSDRYWSRLSRPCSWGDRSRSSDRYRSRRDWSRSSDRSLLCRLCAHSPARREAGVTGCGLTVPPRRFRDRSRSRGRLPSFSARLRSEWTGRAFRVSKTSSVHLSLVASRWGHPAGRVCFLTLDCNEVLLWVADRDSFRMGSFYWVWIYRSDLE